MKKNLFFAIALVAGVLAFTSCEKEGKNEPNNSNEEVLDPAALLSTCWRTEGVYVNGKQQAAPHFYLQILNNPSKAVINSDTVTYSIEGTKLTCDKGTFTVIEYKGTTAKLSDGTVEINLTKMPDLDMDAMKMEYTEDDIVGTWKYAYCDMLHISDFSHTITTNPGVETWTFEKGGKVTYTNSFTGASEEGTWSLEGGLMFLHSPVEGDLVSEYIAVQPLTNNWMGLIRGDGTSYEGHWWYVRVK